MKLRQFIITFSLALLTAVSSSAQKWIVYSITGNPQLVGSNGQTPLKVWDTLGQQSIIDLPDGASLQLIDLEQKRMCVIMRRQDSKDRLTNLIQLSGNNVTELSQNQLDYMKSQIQAVEKQKQADKSNAPAMAR